MNRRSFLRSSIAAGSAGLATSLLRAVPPNASEVSVIRLNGNENALGPAPGAREAIRKTISVSNRYPIAHAAKLTTQIADQLGIPPESVLLGNGSSEILRLAVQVLVERNPLVVTAQPTYEAIGRHASALGIEVKQVPLTSGYSHDLNRMKYHSDAHSGDSLVYLCNPNNPTATLTPTQEIHDWVASEPADTRFIVDEAYFEYVDDVRYTSLIPLALKKKNLLVARTFSKVYALAGLRIGYAIAHPGLIEHISSLTRLNTNAVALAAASASLADPDFVQQSIRSNRESKQIVTDTLSDLNLPFLPSHTNFVMHRLAGSIHDYRKRMEDQGVLVGRPFPPFDNYCRISLGLPSEMKKYSAIMRQFRTQGWI
jgi:histidinol-phosphate aminotransferase